MWVDKHTVLEQFFLLFKYKNKKYDIPRARLEFHFELVQNFKCSVKTIIKNYAYYISMEKMD